MQLITSLIFIFNKMLHKFYTQKKPKHLCLGFNIKSLAIPYFRMANCHTIIGAKRFHFRVRDGIGWFTFAMVTKQTGVVGFHQLSFTNAPLFAISNSFGLRICSWKSVTSRFFCCLLLFIFVFFVCD